MNFRVWAAKQPALMAQMFDTVAPRYDLMNDLLSLGRDAHWRRSTTAALHVNPGEKVLDLAAGTGTSSEPLVQAGGLVFALDLSAGMVAVGRKRHPEINFAVGDAGALPFTDRAFNVVTVSFGLRNMPNPVGVLRELARVTTPGGRLVVCEFSTPGARWLRAANRWWLRAVVPLAKRLSTNPDSYGYLADSILDWPDQETVAAWLRDAGWQDVEYKNLTGGIVALHMGKR